MGKRVFGRVHYNAIAKDIREEFTDHRWRWEHAEDKDIKKRELAAISALTQLALRLARRFKKDNDLFDPLVFLDACSSDPERYPLSELWEGPEGQFYLSEHS